MTYERGIAYLNRKFQDSTALLNGGASCNSPKESDAFSESRRLDLFRHVELLSYRSLIRLLTVNFYSTVALTTGIMYLKNIEALVAQWLACWTIVPKIVGSNPAEAFGFFMSVKKSFSMPSFRMGK